MRYKIWKKDDFFQFNSNPDRRIDMDASVVDISSEELPLVWQFAWKSTPFGKVTAFRLEDGEITGELNWASKNESVEHAKALLEAGDVRLGGHYKEVYYTDETKTRVEKAKLVGVSLVMKEQIPGWQKEKN